MLLLILVGMSKSQVSVLAGRNGVFTEVVSFWISCRITLVEGSYLNCVFTAEFRDKPMNNPRFFMNFIICEGILEVMLSGFSLKTLGISSVLFTVQTESSSPSLRTALHSLKDANL